MKRDRGLTRTGDVSRNTAGEVITMMYDGDGGGAWWWMIPMILVTIIAVAAVVWAIVRTSVPSGPERSERHATPDEILARRLASGEIDTNEYRARLDALHHSGQR